jgi:hypothetical protein
MSLRAGAMAPDDAAEAEIFVDAEQPASQKRVAFEPPLSAPRRGPMPKPFRGAAGARRCGGAARYAPGPVAVALCIFFSGAGFLIGRATAPRAPLVMELGLAPPEAAAAAAAPASVSAAPRPRSVLAAVAAAAAAPAPGALEHMPPSPEELVKAPEAEKAAAHACECPTREALCGSSGGGGGGSGGGGKFHLPFSLPNTAPTAADV